MTLLEQLEKDLKSKLISAKLKLINTENINQSRVYVNLDKQFQTYFIEFEEKLFLKVYIQRMKGYDFSGLKQSDLETERCRKAKLNMLMFLRTQEIMLDKLETSNSVEEILISPKSQNIKISLS